VVEVGRVKAGRVIATLAVASCVLLMAFSFAGAAGGVPCWPMAGGQELSVAGLGQVVFDALTTDRARDAASLTGSVCVTLSTVGGVLRTERLDVTGLTRNPALAAGDVSLSLPGWELTAAELRSDGVRARLRQVAMRGAEAVGLADLVVIDLDSGEVVAYGLRLATETVWLDALRGSFDGTSVQAEGAQLTTCACPPEEAPMRLEADTARLDLSEFRLRLQGGVLHLRSIRSVLPDPFELDAAMLASPPLALGLDPEGVRGLVLRGLEREVAPEVRFGWDVGIGQGARPPDAAWRLTAMTDGASIDVVGGSEAIQAAWSARWPLTGGFGLRIAQRLEAGAVPEPVRDQTAGIDWRATVGRQGVGWSSVEIGASAMGALSAQSLEDGAEVVGTRWGVEASARVTAEDPTLGQLETVLMAGAHHYPRQDATQAWIELAPTWKVRSGPWALEVEHVAVWVAGASPFGVRLDRRLPTQRTDASLTVTTAIAEGWSLSGSATLRLDWSADAAPSGRISGMEWLKVRFDLTGPAWGGLWTFGAAADLAGWIDARPGRAAVAAFGASWSGHGREFGTRVGLQGGAAGTTWTEAAVFASWTIGRGDLAWRPYLAFDLAALGRGGAGWWSGHGLDLAWTSCCGILELGYRHDDALGTRLRGGFRLETHPLELERLIDAADARGRVPAPVTTP
jgi:hypothetical protein